MREWSNEKERKSKEKKALEYVQKLHREHKGDWLDWNAVEEYRTRLRKLNIVNFEYIGEVRKLGVELQEKYGILEIEAINILRGYHAADYVDKYQRIKYCIPLNVTSASKYLEGEE